ncbi:MAG: FG-GAP repeat protein [Bacteroidetes bacterium]|nr:FG-GAP repeat protein [Bacteroidota bacterium]
MRAKKIQTFSFTFLLILLSFGNAFSQSSDTKIIKLDDANLTGKKTIEIESDALSMSTLYGQTANSLFGNSTATAGDVNGDGYPDIIVGAPYPTSETGKAYIYYGGPSYDIIPDVILTGETAADLFGSSVASAGDFNGDGYDDIIVGAKGYKIGGTQVGKVYIYYGGVGMNSLADAVIYGSANESIGNSISTAGDFNGDGFSDIIIGSPIAANQLGRVYLYLGGIFPDFTADYTFEGQVTNMLFGTSIACAGDVNADGYSDILVGGNNDVASPTHSGKALLFYGKAVLTNLNGIYLNGLYQSTGDRFGSCVSSAGDFNGDGYSDFMVSAPYQSMYMQSAGCVYLYLGGIAITGEPNAVYTTLNYLNKIGTSISQAGDINGDGYTDILIGAPNYSNLNGEAFLAYGNANPNGNISTTFGMTFLNGSGQIGTSVSYAGDLNNDGYFEMLISAPAKSPNGAVYIYQNSMSGNDVHDIVFSGTGSSDGFGASISKAGDFNGDGFDDVVIGANSYNNGVGKAVLKLGGAYPENQVSINLIGIGQTPDALGASVDCAGDVNGDGYSDIIVGAPYNGVGRAYIYLGGSSPNGYPDIFLSSGSNNAMFGYSVSTGGDINRDGFSDVIVGAPGINPTDTGFVYVYFGGTNMNNTPDIVLKPDNFGTQWGFCVSGGGDFNKDGYSDFIVGEPGYQTTGRHVLYYGRSNGVYKVQSLLIGTGRTFASNGDINGDGYSDYVISSNNKITIYLGGLFPTLQPSFVINDYEQAIFKSLSLGDVNNDGYDDIIISRYLDARVYFGGKTVDDFPDIQLETMPDTNIYPKYLATYAGDYNNDGIGDILTSFQIGNSSGTAGGNAFLYLSSSPSASPVLNYVKDVARDQGGNVNIKWARSGYDASGISRITDYIVERSYAPFNGQFAWQTIGTIPATNNLFYSYTASTPSDSVNYFFRITARNTTESEYFRSEVVSGRSTDNLSPDAPANLAASGMTNSINLTWRANTEADLRDYLVYRNGRKISEVTTNSFSDLTASSDSTYIYKIAARDIHFNISAYSNADTASLESITIYNVKIIPEGLYNTQTNQLRMRDTVRAFLWDLTGSEIVDSAVSVIDSMTFLADFNFKYAPSGTYYLAIVHRNCIETWSKTGGEPFTKNGSNSYDFTSNPANAYGSNLKLKAGKYCLFSGDVNRSGVVNATDRTLVRNNGGVTGYTRYDLDGNGVVNAADRTIVRNNSGIAKQRP